MPTRRSSTKSSGGRRYGEAASKSVESAMHRKKQGTLKSGKSGHGGTVKSRAQAIAIGLSEARKKGAKVPSARSASSRRSAGGSTRSTSRGGSRSSSTRSSSRSSSRRST